jgi:hypothetical protein
MPSAIVFLWLVAAEEQVAINSRPEATADIPMERMGRASRPIARILQGMVERSQGEELVSQEKTLGHSALGQTMWGAITVGAVGATMAGAAQGRMAVVVDRATQRLRTHQRQQASTKMMALP